MESPDLRRSVPRSLQIIGEATKNLSKGLKDRYPEIEWRQIAGMRDKLVHYYFGVDWDVVWDTMVNELPTLKGQIEAVLREIDHQ